MLLHRAKTSANRTWTLVPSLVVTLIIAVACSDTAVESSGLERILEEFADARGSNVLVVAHRGDWTRAPENSLSAIRNGIALGVDIVEIDLAMTSDSQLVLMHDPTVDRTTNGIGTVSEMTLAEVRQLRLTVHDGTVTDERVPTLREALRAAKGKCMLDLDRAFLHSPEVHRLLLEEGMLGQAIVKSSETPAAAEAIVADLNPKPTYMPTLVDLPTMDRGVGSAEEATAMISRFVDLIRPQAFALAFASDTSPLISEEAVALMRRSGARVWVNTLWDGSLSGGHSDELARENPDEAWGWLIERGVNIIQTDEIDLLLAYLRHRELHW